MSSRCMGLALVTFLPLAACASPGEDYPSLAIRDAERLTGTFTPSSSAATTAASPTAPAPELLNRLAQLQAEAQRTHQAFIALTPRARRLVAAAGNAGMGSDRWAAAQVAVSELDSQRSLTAIPLANLDMLYVGQAVKLEQRAEIAQAQQAVQKLIEQEDAVLQALKGALAQ